MRLRAAVTAVTLLGVAAVPSALAHTGHDRRPGATKFDIEVRITHQGGGGFGPAVAVDGFGNEYAVARKDARAAAYDDRSTAAVRTRSWVWSSADGGATWQDLAPPPTAVEAQQPSDGIDVAATAGAVYVADAAGAQTVVARYRATALGRVSYAGATALPGATGVPQIAAHGKTVALLSPAAPGGAPALRTSTDGGVTFGPPVTLAGSSDCSVAVAGQVLATCTDGGGRLLAFTSHDGRAFASRRLGSCDVD